MVTCDNCGTGQVSVPLYAGIVTLIDLDYRLSLIVSVPLYAGIVTKLHNLIKNFSGVSVPLYAGIVTHRQTRIIFSRSSFSSPVCGDCYMGWMINRIW